MPTRVHHAAGMALALILGIASAAGAQIAAPQGESEAFAESMERALAEAGSAAPLLRCTAFFRAFRLYAGEESEVGATALEHETDLAAAAVVVWQDEIGAENLNAAFETIVPVVGEATELFLARMADNQEERGIVFDDALEAELTYCDTLHAGVAEGDEE